MATVKVRIRLSAVPGNPGTIYYQITHEGKSRSISTRYRVLPRQLEPLLSGTVVHAEIGLENERLNSIRRGIRKDLSVFSEIISRRENIRNAYTADDILDDFRNHISHLTLFAYMAERIAQLKISGKTRTAETYATALKSFRKFRRNKDIPLADISFREVEAYECWMKQRGLSSNTTSFYNRILRAVYNRAVDDEIIENRNPFRRVYTGIGKTVKRALPIGMIKRIRDIDLSYSLSLSFARDMFMMSFYLRGMSFVDMAFLRKTDLLCGHLTYRRRKTGRLLHIGWTREMQQILDRYPENPGGYLLPIIMAARGNERSIYRNVSYNINKNLKKIAGLIGISMPLTLYVARHSWASAARTKGIPLNIISESMGHESESTTRIYLSELDTAVVDRANSLILSALL